MVLPSTILARVWPERVLPLKLIAWVSISVVERVAPVVKDPLVGAAVVFETTIGLPALALGNAPSRVIFPVPVRPPVVFNVPCDCKEPPLALATMVTLPLLPAPFP